MKCKCASCQVCRNAMRRRNRSKWICMRMECERYIRLYCYVILYMPWANEASRANGRKVLVGILGYLICFCELSSGEHRQGNKFRDDAFASLFLWNFDEPTLCFKISFQKLLAGIPAIFRHSVSMRMCVTCEKKSLLMSTVQCLCQVKWHLCIYLLVSFQQHTLCNASVDISISLLCGARRISIDDRKDENASCCKCGSCLHSIRSKMRNKYIQMPRMKLNWTTDWRWSHIPNGNIVASECESIELHLFVVNVIFCVGTHVRGTSQPVSFSCWSS